MILSPPIVWTDGNTLLADQVCKDIFHTGHNPDITAGKGAGEVYQGRIEKDNFAFTKLGRSPVRRGTFHGTPNVCSTGVNMDFTRELFYGVAIYNVCDDPQFLPSAVPIPGAVCTWVNEWAPTALEIHICLVMAVGTDDPKPDWSDPDPWDGDGVTSTGYQWVSGDSKEVTWAGLFLGKGTSAQFAEGFDNFFPLGQTQTRNSDSGSGTYTVALRDYTDVRTWQDRFVLDQAWLTNNVPGLTSANTPLGRGEKTIGLRLASEEMVSRVKRAYITVVPIR